jgi:hypothetical protein
MVHGNNLVLLYRYLLHSNSMTCLKLASVHITLIPSLKVKVQLSRYVQYTAVCCEFSVNLIAYRRTKRRPDRRETMRDTIVARHFNTL